MSINVRRAIAGLLPYTPEPTAARAEDMSPRVADKPAISVWRWIRVQGSRWHRDGVAGATLCGVQVPRIGLPIEVAHVLADGDLCLTCREAA